MGERQNGEERSEERKKAANGRAKPERLYGGMTRRTLCTGVVGVAALLGIGAINVVPKENMVRPPGGQDEEQVIGACIRCEKCVESCPRGVIAPAHVEDGILAMRTPTMYFADDWCDFCMQENGGIPLCVEACPTQSLKLPAGADPETSVLGVAKIRKDWCLAYAAAGCKFCYDACPYDAIYLDDDQCPHIIEDRCNGCGACEAVCVSLKNGSISHGANERAVTVKPLGEKGGAQ